MENNWKINKYYFDSLSNIPDITIECPKCHKEYNIDDVRIVIDSDELFKFCPNCGYEVVNK